MTLTFTEGDINFYGKHGFARKINLYLLITHLGLWHLFATTNGKHDLRTRQLIEESRLFNLARRKGVDEEVGLKQEQKNSNRYLFF